MPLAEAQALLDGAARAGRLPEPALLPDNPDADQAALRSLAWACSRFSPWVSIEPSEPLDTLVLDITGCTHLFGDEWAMAAQVAGMLHRCGYFPFIALADTIGAAWALAHYGDFVRGRPRRLESLPVDALRLPASVVQTLHALDLHRISQLDRLPRASLPSRFGSILIQRLDQLAGRQPESLAPIPPPEPIEACRSFEYPVSDARALTVALRQLLDQVLKTLPPHEGILRLTVRLQTAEKKPVPFEVGLVRPTESAEHLMQLLRLQWERRSLPDQVTDIRIRVAQTAPMLSRQRWLFGDGTGLSGVRREDERHLAELLDRLSNRLGPNCVLRPQLQPDAQPERAVVYEPVQTFVVPALAAKNRLKAKGSRSDRKAKDGRNAFFPGQQTLSLVADRPLQICQPPMAVDVMSVVPEGPPLRVWWNGRSDDVVRSWGPERIQTGWWREETVRRDYFRVELADGRHLWLFRDLVRDQWFLHGTFD